MATPGQEYLVVAAGCSKTDSSQQEKENYLQQLKSNTAISGRRGNQELGPWMFNVPDGDRALMFGSFDNLIRLTDDLQKADSQLDGIVHRLERQYIEIDPQADFVVQSQRQSRPFEEYLKNWQWDEAKYPRTRSIADNLTLLLQVVNKLDEECRSKTAQFNETKTSKANLAKKEGANLAGRDLVDLLTPQVVKQTGASSDHFIVTEHLTTVVVIVSRGGDKDFLNLYEKAEFSEECYGRVVPMSALKFEGLEDKDGNSLWRVVVFKSAAEAFKKACRSHKFIPRDFEYSEDAYKKLIQQREAIEEAVKRQLERVKGLYRAAWSDATVAWMHIKAMRVFVESVLRYGMPPRFGAYIVPVKPGAPAPMRKALAEILGSGANAKEPGGEQGEEEDYYPYVSFSFTPFATARVMA